MGSKRLIVTLTEDDRRWLEGYTRFCKISMAEAIRRGLKKLRDHEQENSYRIIIEHSSGIWRQGDGLAYQDAVRKEWGMK